jgi:gamma-glutamyltranspeptidase/glutathione hydrolase
MSPTIVLHDGKPFLTVGSPGGATIITTVLQILLDRLDFGMTLPEAIGAPRASQRNGPATDAEPAFIAQYGAALTARGQKFNSTAEIGAATGIELLSNGRLEAAAEPVRRGGGAAAVVCAGQAKVKAKAKPKQPAHGRKHGKKHGQTKPKPTPISCR